MTGRRGVEAFGAWADRGDDALRFHILKGGGYHGCVSVEASGFNDLPGTG